MSILSNVSHYLSQVLPKGNSYSNISASGSARQHNGNVYNHANNYTFRLGRSNSSSGDQQLNKAFVLAAAEGQTVRLQTLYERGADVDYEDVKTRTALHNACWNGHLEVARMLLAWGSDINARSKVYGTPLCLAIDRRQREVIDYLLSSGASIGDYGGAFGSALHIACQNGDLHTVKALTQRGCDIDLVRPCFQTFVGGDEGPLHTSGLSVPGVPLYLTCTPLALAVTWSRIEVVRFLLGKGANFNREFYGEAGEGVFSEVGTRRDSLSTLRTQRSHNVVRLAVGTPLIFASTGGCEELVHLLLRHGADVGYVSPTSGETALSSAACRGHTQCVLRLLEYGAEPHSNASVEPLSEAVESNQIETLGVLLEAMTTIEDRATEAAARCRAHKTRALRKALLEDKSECVRLLLQFNRNIHSVDSRGRTPLHLAVLGGSEYCVWLLTSQGANSQLRDCDGKTPLDIARTQGQMKIIRALELADICFDRTPQGGSGTTDYTGSSSNTQSDNSLAIKQTRNVRHVEAVGEVDERVLEQAKWSFEGAFESQRKRLQERCRELLSLWTEKQEP